MTRSCAAQRRGPLGLTLLELLLAVAVTAMAGLALTTALTATARSLSLTRDTRSALQRAHTLCVRMRAYTDAALCLLQHDAERGVAVWLHDENPGNSVNLSELRVFWFNEGEGTITVERVDFPEAWSAAIREDYDRVLPAGSDFFAVMTDERALGMTSTGVLADGASGVVLAMTDAVVQETGRFRLTADFAAGQDESQRVMMAFGLPNHRTPR